MAIMMETMMATLGRTTPRTIWSLRLRLVLLLLLELVEVLEGLGDRAEDERVVAAARDDAVSTRLLLVLVGMEDDMLALVVEDVLVGWALS